jgi:hypothetical protein
MHAVRLLESQFLKERSVAVRVICPDPILTAGRQADSRRCCFTIALYLCDVQPPLLLYHSLFLSQPPYSCIGIWRGCHHLCGCFDGIGRVPNTNAI